MARSRIPPAIIGIAAPILAGAYTHAGLDCLFLASGFPGDPPEGSKIVKCQDWLRRANSDAADPLAIFGQLAAEFLDKEPEELQPWETAIAPDPREPLLKALAREGLAYKRGGHIFGAALTGPSRALADRLSEDGFKTLETEYERAYAQVESDPPAAVTAACAILEAVCKTYLTSEGHPLPNKQVLGTLWSETAARLGLSPKDVADQDMKQVLSGLANIANGVAALRTHKGSAHGHVEDAAPAKFYRLAPRHARLAVHAAHTMALFVMETWEARRSKPPAG
ncbi:MAG: abortive infection family protein [Caulobacteraceae bacterium]